MSQTPWLLCAQGAAFYFVRSAEHDIADLHRLAHDAQSKTVTTLDCSRPSHTKPACPCCHFAVTPAADGGVCGAPRTAGAAEVVQGTGGGVLLDWGWRR